MDTPEPERPKWIDGPWPQKPVLRTDFPAPVIKIDPADRDDHILMNVTRYLGQIILHTPEFGPLNDGQAGGHVV